MAFWYATFFGIMGPLLGAAVLIAAAVPLTFDVGEQGGAARYALALLAALPMSIFLAPFALFVGAVPASITGLTYWWIKSRTALGRLPSLVRAAVMSLVGGAVCILFGWCTGAGTGEMISREMLELLVAPGVAASAMCTLLADWRTSRLSPDGREPRT